MRDIRTSTIIFHQVSHRDLCYVSENEGFCFVGKTIFCNLGVTLRGAAFGEHLTENLPFFSNQGVTLRQAAFGEHLTEN